MVNFLSDAGRKDPSMLGGTNYPRAEHDHYPTPPRATNAFVSVVEDDLEAMQFWEPFVGNGAVYNIIAPHCRAACSSDIVRYDGFEPTALLDFFNIYADGESHENAMIAWEKAEAKAYADYDEGALDHIPPKPLSMSDVEKVLGMRPDAIISNPPYGKEADLSVRKALELMEAEKGFVAFLMRHEWDAAAGRADLIDHPAFAMKITLRFRPQWIEPKPGEKSQSPRFSYAWYVWDFTKALQAPHLKSENHYVR